MIAAWKAGRVVFEVGQLGFQDGVFSTQEGTTNPSLAQPICDEEVDATEECHQGSDNQKLV